MNSVVLYPPDYKQTKLDDGAIARIVAAVERSGRKLARAPTDLDRKKLADDLFGAWIYYEQGKFGAPGSKNRKAAKKRLEDIIKVTAKLNQLLDPPEGHTAEDHATRTALFIGAYCGDRPNKPRHLVEFRASLQELLEVADHIIEMLSSKPTFRALSPLQDFLGDWLPDIYLEHFRKRPGISRSQVEEPGKGEPKQKVGGPYVRFAIAVGMEFGERFSEETVVEYLEHWKKLRKN